MGTADSLIKLRKEEETTKVTKATKIEEITGLETCQKGVGWKIPPTLSFS
jgi:hypothetical protein